MNWFRFGPRTRVVSLARVPLHAQRDVGDFRLVRRKLLASVCDEAFGNVYGSTDSEHFFALFIDSLLDLAEQEDAALRMAQALARASSPSNDVNIGLG